MNNGILVFAEVRGDVFKAINAELIAAAQALGGGSANVSVALVGDQLGAHVETVKQFDVGKVYTATDPQLDNYSSQGFALAMEAIVTAAQPRVVLFGATSMGKDLSARVAAKLSASLFTDCTEVSMEGDSLKVMRPLYSGKIYAEMLSQADLQMASIRSNIYPAAEATSGGSAEVVEVAVTIGAGAIKGKVREVVSTSGGQKDLTEAEIVVSGGRSLKSGENFGILEELAEVLEASVGASRAAVDAGYVPHSMQVGQTGKVVNPKLYIACGISGAIQHLVGMRTAKVIVSINKDENAPIFQKSDYGIQGDLFEVVPLLTKEFKELLGK